MNSKLKSYQEKLELLETIELPNVIKRIGESATDGDWHENADYEDAVLQKEVTEAKIEELRSLIISLTKTPKTS